MAPHRPGAGRHYFAVLPSAIGLREGGSVTYLGLIGDKVIDIVPGPVGAPSLEVGDTLPVATGLPDPGAFPTRP
jgi:hypothetical protein